MEYQTILYEVGEDKVATITINRPEAMNSFNAQMNREFVDVWKRIIDLKDGWVESDRQTARAAAVK